MTRPLSAHPVTPRSPGACTLGAGLYEAMTRLAWPMTMALALCACNRAPTSPGTTPPVDQTPAGAPTAKDIPPVSNAAQKAPAPAIRPPSADSVLYVIYGKDGDGATSYEVGDGSWVNWWYGYEFAFKGRQWYTGFSWMSPEKFGEDADQPDGPDTTVAIGQATFEMTREHSPKPWAQIDTDGYVGEFGAYAKAVAVDTKRKPERFDSGDGRMLLAIPTVSSGNGVASYGYALLVFDPDKVAPLRNGLWAYLGLALAGTDNADACDQGQVMPCESSTGILSFQAAPDGGLPGVTITLAGTTIDQPGKVRTLGAQDAVHYHFDTGQGHYVR